MGSLWTSMIRPSAPQAAAGQRHRRDQPVDAGGVAGVDDDRQVRQLVQHGHGRQIERVAGVIVKGADAALAEDDVARCRWP